MKVDWSNWLPFQPWRTIGMVESAADVPARLPRKAAVLVGTGGQIKWVAFDCACGTGHRIMLNTDASRRPFWSLQNAGRAMSISPSVDYRGQDRRCHYFIRAGQTKWAKDHR
jgi:hypothetical protein